MTTTHTQGCQHTHRALGWTIITAQLETEYGSDNDSRTLDQIGRDLHEMQVRGQNPLLVEIGDIYDFMYVLRQSKPGETVKAVVVRDGERVTLEVTFGVSRRMR